MNAAYHTVMSAAVQDRRGLFAETAQRLGTIPAHIEKDFWVCFVLGILFGRNSGIDAQLLFKGGTSLSKGFGLINRFSEDIDVTVFRTSLGHDVLAGDLAAMSGKQRERVLDRIHHDCRDYIHGPLRTAVERAMIQALGAAGFRQAADWRIEANPEDDQSLLFWYPSCLDRVEGEYVRRAVLIESGAKSAVDPHVIAAVKPYIAAEMADANFVIPGITTADPRRTFWDKVVVAHGQHQWFLVRGEIKNGGERLTRHYYDLHQLINSSIGMEAIEDLDLARDVSAHAGMFFNQKKYNLGLATPGSYTLSPHAEMLDALRIDYEKMAGMIFGSAPDFDDVIASVAEIEARANTSSVPRP